MDGEAGVEGQNCRFFRTADGFFCVFPHLVVAVLIMNRENSSAKSFRVLDGDRLVIIPPEYMILVLSSFEHGV